jgi:N-acetylneuraminate synthase/N,N'-diacetyllegionaminate synthase
MFGDIVGYSDHTRGTIVADTAFTVGAKWVEKHFTVTPHEGGDSDFAISPVQLQRLTIPQEGMQRDWPGLLGDPGLYCRDVEREAVAGARRSMVAMVDIAAGEDLAGAVEALRPGGGLEPTIRKADLYRAVALRDIAAGETVQHDWVTW